MNSLFSPVAFYNFSTNSVACFKEVPSNDVSYNRAILATSILSFIDQVLMLKIVNITSLSLSDLLL